jgi:hypothetical protein
MVPLLLLLVLRFLPLLLLQLDAKLIEALTDALIAVLHDEEQKSNFLDVYYKLLQERVKHGPGKVGAYLEKFVMSLNT